MAVLKLIMGWIAIMMELIRKLKDKIQQAYQNYFYIIIFNRPDLSEKSNDMGMELNANIADSKQNPLK